MIHNFAYKPAEIVVTRGTTVTFSNRDTTNHTVTADRGTFDLGNLNPGQARSFSFNQPGTFTYHCNYHPFMHGTIVVR
ncbi:MAG: cupredoxin domain-containing protein [Solirubrobacteraceae bacterium]